MKNIIKKSKRQKGYAILFTVVIVSAISVITAGLSNAAYKQLVLSSLAKDSQSAFYQADTAGDCALYADRVNPGSITTVGGAWSCGNSSLNVTPTTGGGYTIYPIDPNSLNACFRIDVTKTITSGGGGPPSWQTGMVSWWKLDEDTTDSVGPNNGTANGATATGTDCKIGQCYLFHNYDESIDAGNGATLRSFNEVTLATWAKFEEIDYSGNSGGLMSFMGKGNIDDGSSPTAGWWFSYDNRNNGDTFSYLAFGNTSGGYNGGGNNFADVSYTFSNNTWYHIAVTVNNAGAAKLYINGTQVGSTHQFTNWDLSNTSDNLFLGQNLYGYWFDGSLDEMMIWNRALSLSEIQDVYNSTGSTTVTVTKTEVSAKGYNICKKSNVRTVEREIQIDYQE